MKKFLMWVLGIAAVLAVALFFWHQHDIVRQDAAWKHINANYKKLAVPVGAITNPAVQNENQPPGWYCAVWVPMTPGCPSQTRGWLLQSAASGNQQDALFAVVAPLQLQNVVTPDGLLPEQTGWNVQGTPKATPDVLVRGKLITGADGKPILTISMYALEFETSAGK